MGVDDPTWLEARFEGERTSDARTAVLGYVVEDEAVFAIDDHRHFINGLMPFFFNRSSNFFICSSARANFTASAAASEPIWFLNCSMRFSRE